MVQSNKSQKYLFTYGSHCTSTCNDCLLRSPHQCTLFYTFLCSPPVSPFLCLFLSFPISLSVSVHAHVKV